MNAPNEVRAPVDPDVAAEAARYAMTGDLFRPTTNLQAALWLTASARQAACDDAPNGLQDSLMDAAWDVRMKLNDVDLTAFLGISTVANTIRDGARWLRRRP